jgi:hypothetical protein
MDLMGKEREFSPAERGEIPKRGGLYLLSHPGTEEVFSGYGLVVRDGFKDYLVGVLMVDRPRPALPEWLRGIEAAFGEHELVEMTPAGERGILCQMQIEDGSLAHLRGLGTPKAKLIQEALQPLLEDKPRPVLKVRWDEERRLWTSELLTRTLVAPEAKEVFEKTGSGCFAVETTEGIAFLAAASDEDVEGFAGSPVLSQWQLIDMPTAPLIRLHLTILDRPHNPYRFEAFFNISNPDSCRILSEQLGQDSLVLAFLGGDLEHHFSKILPFSEEERGAVHQLVGQAIEHLASIPKGERDFDLAKAEFQKRVEL